VLIRQDQRQTVTQRIDPKLIMANAILQQTSLELAQHIEAELLENPALDIVEEVPACNGDCLDPANCPCCSQRLALASREKEGPEPLDLEPDLYVETVYEADDDYDPLGNVEAELTLQEHLRNQLRASLPDEDYWIGDYLISSLNESGRLAAPVEDIAAELGIPQEDVTRVLKVIQTLDPPGVGARDLQECLLIQLQYLREDGRGDPVAEGIVRHHFGEITKRRYTKLARALGTTPERVRRALSFIATQLNPFPASQFRPPWVYKPTNSRSAVRPDVVIRRTEFGYEVDVQGGESFLLGVNPNYRELYNTIRRGNGHLPEQERKHVTEYVERAELFIRNINQRRKTLRLITQSIIEAQQGFLETGSRRYLRPLTRTRIAQMRGLHESTVSRATANKYVQLPNQEVVPFDIFFNPSLSVKVAIEEIISREDPARPLSDQQIAEMLREKGITVARRTVVKYREAQKLLSSTRRRR